MCDGGKYDVVIMATGASSIMPASIKGIEKAISAVEMLETGMDVGERVVVVGGGMVGCEKIIAVGGTQWKLDLARELGATHTVNRREEEDLEAAIKAIAPEGGKCIVEATGHTEMCTHAVNVLGKMGTLYFAAVYHEPFPFFPNMAVNGTYKHGGMGDWDSVPNIEKLMQLTVEGKLPVDKMITYYDFDDMDKAMDDLAHQRVIKAVLKVNR